MQVLPRNETKHHFIKIAEICEVVGVSRKTVRKWVDEGILKSQKLPLSNHCRILRTDWDHFAKDHEIILKDVENV